MSGVGCGVGAEGFWPPGGRGKQGKRFWITPRGGGIVIPLGNHNVNLHRTPQDIVDHIGDRFEIIFLNPVAGEGIGSPQHQTILLQLLSTCSFNPGFKGGSAQLQLQTFKYLAPETFK